MRLLLLLLVSLLGTAPLMAAEPAPAFRTETAAQRDARMAWWREARYGMFIHWGVYAQLAGHYKGEPIGRYGEQIMLHAKIPIAEYAAVAPQFNPVQFDADAWVKLARDAGMKYLVITAKHHDGFAMFATKADPFNIMDASPFKRDVIKELADACKRQGIRFGVYYSQNLDWFHPGGGGRTADPSHKGDATKYVEDLVIPQLTELMTNYGDISVLWWDMGGGVITNERARRICAMIWKHQPGIIMNNRLGGGYHGDTETPEQYVPPQGFPGRDWETCMTLNNTWGYKRQDRSYKPVPMLLTNLVNIASKGGNYLLNIGPDDQGLVPAEQQERLRAIGRWLQVNGEAIYGTSATPFGEECGEFSATEKDKNGKPVFKARNEWRCTAKPGKVYLHFLKWPTTPFTFDTKGRVGTVTKARLLSDAGKDLPLTTQGTTITITLPPTAPDPVVSVVALDVTP